MSVRRQLFSSVLFWHPFFEVTACDRRTLFDRYFYGCRVTLGLQRTASHPNLISTEQTLWCIEHSSERFWSAFGSRSQNYKLTSIYGFQNNCVTEKHTRTRTCTMYIYMTCIRTSRLSNVTTLNNRMVWCQMVFTMRSPAVTTGYWERRKCFRVH